jgi:hypothetical protein
MKVTIHDFFVKGSKILFGSCGFRFQAGLPDNSVAVLSFTLSFSGFVGRSVDFLGSLINFVGRSVDFVGRSIYFVGRSIKFLFSLLQNILRLLHNIPGFLQNLSCLLQNPPGRLQSISVIFQNLVPYRQIQLRFIKIHNQTSNNSV